MIGHDRARQLAASAQDFDLAPGDAEALRRHIAGCLACHAVVDGLASDVQRIAALPTFDAPDHLRDRIVGPSASPDHVAESGSPVPEVGASLAAGNSRRFDPVKLARFRAPAAIAAAAVVVIAVIAGTLFWRPDPDQLAVTSPRPSVPGVTGPMGSWAPIPSASPDSRPDGSGWAPVAALEPDDVQGGVLGLGTGFRLTSLDGTPAAEFAKYLTVEPKIEVVVEPIDDGAVRIVPSEPLVPGTVYRFTLSNPEGRTLDSWAFQASQPVRVVSTLPADTDTDVPLDTGIEVTFDQDGVVGAADHMTITPSVAGRFEQRGRVLSFVPDEPLAPSTLYEVVITSGATVEGTGETLEQDVRFRFETVPPGGSKPVDVELEFSDDLFESSTAERPALGIWAFLDWVDQAEEPKPPETVDVDVYRIDDLAAAIDAFGRMRAFPRWTRHAAIESVTTDGMQAVLGVEAPLREAGGMLWFELPDRLPAGWYVVEVATPTTPIQAMLQVTDVAGYLVVSDSKTLVWSHDLASGGPLAGARVSTGGTPAAAVDLGSTNADGLLLAETPASLRPADGRCADPCTPVVVVRSGDRAAILPATGMRDPEGKGLAWDPFDDGGNTAYWRVFATDRTILRRDDTLEAWGVVRHRDTGRVPEDLTMRLVQDDGGGTTSPPVSSIEVSANELGVFTGAMAIRDAPEGAYQLQLWSGDTIIDSVTIEVAQIRKPAYRLGITTGRRVYVADEYIRVTATASFYEGSPVPGLPLRIDGVLETSLVTDSAGIATRRVVARFTQDELDEADGQPRYASVGVTPAREEEADIAGVSREILIFPSAWTFKADSTIARGRVRVTGSLHEVDRDRLEREIGGGAAPWSVEHAGAPIGGRTVVATFVEIVPRRYQSGTRYDFIEKRAVPVYEYEFTEREAGTVRVRTDDDGRFAASIPADDEGHSYRVRLSATDPDDHRARWTGSADRPDPIDDERPAATLGPTDGETDGANEHSIGDTIDLTMHDPAATSGEPSSYLFYAAQRGVRSAIVQSSSRYLAPFDEASAPGVWVAGVRFDGQRYFESPGYTAMFRAADRALSVDLSTDTDRYAPGDEMAVTVTTRDRDDHPVAATVVVRAVDEKLFTIGAAAAIDPLPTLYAGVSVGVRATYRTHRPPRSEFSGGDTGGGGPDRVDFRDALQFQVVDTGADGRATITLTAPDDLTSWRILASAIGDGLLAGQASAPVAVGLPFFVDAAIAPTYLASDRPAIGLAAFGSALEAGQRITFAVDSDSLDLHVDDVRADAFERTSVPLPPLTVGTHRITVTARSGRGASAHEDRLTRSFEVVASRLSRTTSRSQPLTEPSGVSGGPGRNEIVIADVSVARYVPLLQSLVDAGSPRLERALAASVAAELLDGRARDADGTGTDPEFDRMPYQTPSGGLAILPYASADLEASVLAAIVAPSRFDVTRLEAYFTGIAADDAETRERRTFALAGLAGLGAPVLPGLRAAAGDPELTIRERLMLGLGAAALGDARTARSIRDALVATYGEAVTDQARLRVGTSDGDIVQGTALMALLAAMTDDPFASRFWAYVEANPDEDATYALHAAGFAQAMETHAPATPASFAYVVDRERHVVHLDPGATFRLIVTEQQVATLTLEPLEGDIAIVTSWQEPVVVESLERDPDITIERLVEPAGAIGSDDLVRVTLDVSVDASAPAGCHPVVETVPSGLVAVGNLQGWITDEEGETQQRAMSLPYRRSGQRLEFCYSGAPLWYVARVVTRGTYTWEPAIVASRTGPDRAAWTASASIEIR